MVNPFDLPGPQFLLFFVVAAALLNGLAAYWLRRPGEDYSELAAAGKVIRDPYMLAYLRAGAKEMLRIAIFGLTHRKLLSNSDATVKLSNPEALEGAANELEKRILQQCRTSQSLDELMESGLLLSTAEHYAGALKRHGLLATAGEYRRRVPMLLLVGGVIFALAAIKISVALSRGRHNIVFLIALALIALFVCFAIFRFRRTPFGNQVLRNQQTLFAHLRRRVNGMLSQGATNDAIIVAAVFGLASLPALAFPFARRLRFAPRSRSDSSNCGSGSSCSSSSCGSSCGGGGGCGGCGS